jgi:toxin-antitoxin system PIN domain toxin
VIHLLDVNILLALSWPNHLHHDAAHTWFGVIRKSGWATCPITQAGFVRISCQPSVSPVLVHVQEVIGMLTRNTSVAEHHFWKHETPLSEIHEEMRARVMGPKQVTDAILLDLAIRHGGKFATFDRRTEELLPRNSKNRDSLAILPIS